MTFTRNELFEWFSEKYTQAQVIQALTAISKYDSSVDPSAEVFPDEITEQLEGAFDVGERILQDSPDFSLSEAKNTAIETSKQLYPNLDTRIFDEFIYIVAERAIARAAALSKLENSVFDAASAQLGAENLDKLRDRNERQIQAFQLIANNDERINKILEEYGVNSQQQTQKWIDTYEQVLQQDEEDFDPEQYLTELRAIGDKTEKKPLNKSQSRKLVKHIFHDARKAG